MGPDAEAPETESDAVRFVTERSKFGSRLFHPAKNGALSVCVADGRDDDALEAIGRTHLPALFGWARTHPETFAALGLHVDRDDRPFLGHANVTGFPSDEALLRSVKAKLRAESRIVRREETLP